MDCSDRNKLGRSYMITSRVNGVCLNDVCDNLTDKEEIQLGEAIADEILSFRRITFQSVGPLVYSQDDPQELSVGHFRDGQQSTPLPNSPWNTLKDWLLVLLRWRKTSATSNQNESNLCQI